MSTIKKSSKPAARKSTAKKKIKAVVSEAVGNYEKHPFFVKKANAAKELLQKVGLPDSIKTKVKVG
jgi:hypothetical protein